jgi:hypothetical protein
MSSEPKIVRRRKRQNYATSSTTWQLPSTPTSGSANVDESPAAWFATFMLSGDLVERPVRSVASTAIRDDVSFVSANKAVAKLVDLGLLVETTGRGHDRVFRCDRVLQILER